MSTINQDNSGIDWNAYSNTLIGGTDFNPDTLISDVSADFNLPSSYKKKFEHYDPTGEEYLKSTAALQFETANIETGKAVHDLYMQNQDLRRSSGFEGAGVYDKGRDTSMLWDLYDLGKKEQKIDLVSEIYNERKSFIKDTFQQAVALEQMRNA